MMGFLRGLLWVVFAVTLVTVAMYMTGDFALADRLTSFFLTVQPWLPLTLDFDQFLVVLTVMSLIVVTLIVTGCTGLMVLLLGRLSLARQRELGQAAAAKREIGHVREERQRQHERLITLSQLLTKRLDKRVVVHAVVKSASRMTSVTQANSVVSVWLLNLETDTMRFETGMYCDESMFTKGEFQPSEAPFSRVISTQKSWILPSWKDEIAFIKPDKLSRLDALSGAMVVPLMIENSVLSVLVVFCHSDIIKSYEEQKLFYEATWGELALGLAIAIQGEVAILDRLTGVHNREYFMKRLIQEIERANRYQLPISVLMVDIDNFKAVNDTLGHPQGDAVLKIIAKLLKKEIRAIDLAGRYGGEEFIIMLPDTGYGGEAAQTAGTSGALIVAERIRKAIDEEFQGMQKPLNLTVSVGVMVRRYPEEKDTDYRDLIRLADEQLYRAKTTGKNKVCVKLPDQPEEYKQDVP